MWIDRLPAINRKIGTEHEGKEKQKPEDLVPYCGRADRALPGDRGMLPAGRAGAMRDCSSE